LEPAALYLFTSNGPSDTRADGATYIDGDLEEIFSTGIHTGLEDTAEFRIEDGVANSWASPGFNDFGAGSIGDIMGTTSRLTRNGERYSSRGTWRGP
jgi:hypothetical protein